MEHDGFPADAKRQRVEQGAVHSKEDFIVRALTSIQADLGVVKSKIGVLEHKMDTMHSMVTHEEAPQPHHTARLRAMMKQQVPSWEHAAPHFHAFCEAIAVPPTSPQAGESKSGGGCDTGDNEFDGHVAAVLQRDNMAILRSTILSDMGIRLPSTVTDATATATATATSIAAMEVKCILPVLLEWITSLPPQNVCIQRQYLPRGAAPGSVWVSDAVDDDHVFVFRAVAAYALAAIRFWWAQPHCKGVIVTGSPGIGKTWMGNYLLWWFLQQTEQTTVVYRSGKAQEVVLYDPSRDPDNMRLFHHVDPSLPLKSSKQAHQPHVILSDMYGKRAHKYIPSGRHGFEIVISSPNREEFHDFGTSDGRFVWIPELSTAEASHALRCMLRQPASLHHRHMADLLGVFGGRPRPILQALRAATTNGGTSTVGNEHKEAAPTSYLELAKRDDEWIADVRNELKLRAILHHGNILALQHSLAARTSSSDRAWSHKLVGYTPAYGLQRATVRWATRWVAWTTTQYIMASSREQLQETLASVTNLAGVHGSLFGTVFEMAVHTVLQSERQRCPLRRLLPSASPRNVAELMTHWPTRDWREWHVDVPSAAIDGDALLRHTCAYLVPAVSNFPVVDGFLCLDAAHLEAFLGISDGGNGSSVVGVQITHAKQHAPSFDKFVNFAVRHCMTAAGKCVLTDLLFIVPAAQYEAYRYQPIAMPTDAAALARVPAAVLDALRALRQWVLRVSFHKTTE